VPWGSQLVRVTSGLADSVVYMINVVGDPQVSCVDRILTKALVIVDQSLRDFNRGNPKPAIRQREYPHPRIETWRCGREPS
jgi:hypothetical protein